MSKLKTKLIAAFIAAGLSAPAAFVAYDLTLPSEGLVLSPYADPVGLRTACVGHLVVKGEKVKDKYTEEECMTIFAKDYKKHQDETDKMVGGKDKFASEWQRAAATDMTFNNGAGLIGPSTMISLIKQGRHIEACKQLTRWVKAKGKTLKGLVIRRDKTMPYCLGELSWDKQKAFEEFEREYNEIKKATSNP
ncbi:Lysozyme RrrD [compost metagenome]